MGRRKELRKKIASLEARIAEHQRKIEQENARPKPNQRLIEKWRKEIATWEAQVKRAQRRLGQKGG